MNTLDKQNTNTTRFYFLDAFRGFAIINMVIFHFCFALSDLRFTNWNFYTQEFWLWWRLGITSSFIITMGMSAQLSLEKDVSKSYWLRIGVLILCSGFVSASTWLTVGDRWVYFGILHFMALASLLILPFRFIPKTGFIVGIVIIYGQNIMKNKMFDSYTFLQFLGLITFRPLTNDYVPLIPWFGLALVGFGTMSLVKKRLVNLKISTHTDLFPGEATLIWLGRKSLWVYMVHIAAIYAFLHSVRIIFY